MRRRGVTRRGALGGVVGTVVAGEAEARVGASRFFGGGAHSVPVAVPTAVNLSPSSATVLDNATSGTNLSSISVTMSDASGFSGALSENGPFTSISGSNLQLSRNLTSGDAGSTGILVSATQNSVTASSTFNLTVNAVGPATPVSVNLSPSSAVVVDTTSVPVTLCSIGVTMSDGSTFTGSLSENNANTSISGTNLRLDTMPADGLVGILVSATQNSVTASATFNLTIAAFGAGTNFVTGFSPAGPVGATGDFAGMRINLGTNSPSPPPENGPTYPLLVSALGRWVVSGNNQTHTLKIVDALTNLDVVGSSVTVDCAGKPANAFTYATLSSPVTLGANQSYYIVSSETGSDQLLDPSNAIGHTGVAFPPSAIHGSGSSWSQAGPYESCFGPLDFVYTLGPVVNAGSPLPAPGRTDYGAADSFVMGSTFGATRVSGTVIIDGSFVGFNIPAANSVVVQYFVDGQPVSPYITGPVTTGGNFPWSVNTATHPAFGNGTHSVVAKFIDSNPASSPTKAAYQYRCYPMTMIVQNPAGTGVGDYSASQLVPTGMLATAQPYGATSWLPNLITYPGSVPTVNSHPRPNFAVAPSSDPKYRAYEELYIEDMSAMKTQEFIRIPVWATTNKGGIYIDYSYPDTGGAAVEDFYPSAFRSPTKAGGRCSALTTPMSTFIPNPRAGGDTGYIGITLQGGLIELGYNGNVAHLAGISWDPTKPGFDNFSTRNPSDTENFVDEDTVVGQCIVKGTITGFAAEEFGGLNDLCVDPRDFNKVYLTNYIDSFIILVDLNFDPPHCSVYAGQPGVAGYVNVTGTGAVNALFDGPSSIIMCDGAVSGFPAGTMLVCDHANSAIRRISPDGLTVTTLCGNQTSKPTTADLSNPGLSDTWSPPGSVSFTPGNDTTGAYVNWPFTIRFASDKSKVVFIEMYTSTLRTISITSNTITRIPNTKQTFAIAGQNGWTWFDIDTLGVLGPVDDIAIVTAVGAAFNIVYFRVSLDGSYTNPWVGDGAGRIGEGPGDQAGTVFAPIPIYPWVAAFSKTRSHFLGGGFRYYGLYAGRPRHPSDPVINLGARIGINIDVFDKCDSSNQGIWWNGTCMCFPLGSRPSLAALYGELGNNLLGSSIVPNFDDLSATYPTDGSFTDEICAPGTLGRYLQDGGAGQVPQPELTGNDLRAVCYFIRRVALSGSYPTAVEPGPENPDTAIPLISGVSATRLSNDSLGNPRLQVSWTTDKRTIGIALAGSPPQVGTGLPYSAWSPIESAFGTSHTAIVTECPVASPLHYCVIAKDVAGNSSYSDDQTIA